MPGGPSTSLDVAVEAPQRLQALSQPSGPANMAASALDRQAPGASLGLNATGPSAGGGLDRLNEPNAFSGGKSVAPSGGNTPAREELPAYPASP